MPLGLDFFALADLLKPEEREVQRSSRAFLEAEALPGIREQWEKGEFPRHLVPRLGAQGMLGASLPAEQGGAGVSSVAYGLVMYELERIDSGLRSFASVQSALVMYPIARYGSPEQQRRYLPELGRGRLIGCFGLTESDGGSDPVGNMKTRARRDGDRLRALRQQALDHQRRHRRRGGDLGQGRRAARCAGSWSRATRAASPPGRSSARSACAPR